jgi:DNA-binding CsgD family transcriptional regulator
MRTASLVRQPVPPPADPAVPGGVELLVRRLIDHLAAHPTSDLDDEPLILLDVEVDGVRCVLQRVVPRGRSEVLLSPREREIARMVARGYPNKAIAGVLEISTWTVGTYLRRIFAKLGVCSRAAMVARLSMDGVLSQ